MSVHIWDGSSAVAADSLHVQGEPDPVRAVPMPHGSPSVAAMLDLPMFYWAHRGGSLDFPEMSLYAYTQAALHGVHALEVSCALTSDGVWFGLHDQTLKRTSGVDIDPTTLTWSQVQQYMIAPPSGSLSDPQPYMRLEEVMEAYGSSHVIVLDPKYQLFKGGEMLDIALRYAPSTRLIAKYAGTTLNTVFPAAAAARNVLTWGYFSGGDSSVIPTQQAKWDLLGMEHSSSQAAWDLIKSYGKPVVSWIVGSKAQADDSVAKGADGLQIGSVRNVLGPV